MANDSKPVKAPRGRSFGLRITREGKWFVGVTILVGLAAVNTGNNLLYLVLGLLLSLIILSGVLSEMVLWRMKIERLLPTRAFAANPAVIEIAVANSKGRLSSYSVEVEDIAKGAPTERRCYFLKVAAGARQTAAYRRTPTKRGYLDLVGLRAATRYPFGLFEKWRIVRSEDRLLVYPSLTDVAVTDRARAAGIGDSRASERGVGEEVAWLREWRSGDEARIVHWRRSASLGEIVVRERERATSERIAIIVDNGRPIEGADAWAASFERAISRAASLAAWHLSEGHDVVVVTRGGRSDVVPAKSPADPIWRFLALLEAVDRAIPFASDDIAVEELATA